MKVRKPSLQFELTQARNASPVVDTYFGGVPFVTDKREIHECPKCNEQMTFVMQVLVPERKTKEKKLYSFYYCFGCVEENTEGSFAINIYHNPVVDNLKIDVDYIPTIPRFDVQFTPAYELPEWDYLEGVFPEIKNKFELLYGKQAYEAYIQVESKVKESFPDTGLKIKGYPESMMYDNVPHCPIAGTKMEPFISMESMPEINVNWVGKESYLMLFKSVEYDEFALRCIDFGDEYDESFD